MLIWKRKYNNNFNHTLHMGYFDFINKNYRTYLSTFLCIITYHIMHDSQYGESTSHLLWDINGTAELNNSSIA